MRWPLLLLACGGCLPDLGARSVGAHAGRCGDCHADHAMDFAASRHAQSASSQAFVALRARAESTQGIGGFCDGCHLPQGEEVTCVTCHGAAGNQRTANGALLWDLTGPVRGPNGDTEASHASMKGDLLVSSQLCGTCHEVDGVGAFHETPYSNWLRSEAAEEGERCQDCHQPTVDGRSSHRFAGLGSDQAVDLLQAGLVLEAGAGVVVLHNEAGHALPDGAAFTRELWVESRRAGQWLGDRHALHPELWVGEDLTWDPLVADRVEHRRLEPGEQRVVAVQGDEACVRFRPLAAGLAEGLGLEVPEVVEVGCVTVR